MSKNNTRNLDRAEMKLHHIADKLAVVAAALQTHDDEINSGGNALIVDACRELRDIACELSDCEMHGESLDLCCICGEPLPPSHPGRNDPWPVVNDDDSLCCDKCNREKVIPARRAAALGEFKAVDALNG